MHKNVSVYPFAIIILLMAEVFMPVKLRANIFSVTDYGAKADGSTVSTKAIQKTIDLCADHGGGKVYVPSGTYLTGTLHLRSNMVLYLESGAVLKSTGNLEDFPLQKDNFRYLIFGDSLINISIEGNGTIEGSGENDLGIPRDWKGQGPEFRYHLINLAHCEDVTIKNVILRYSEMFTLLLHKCERVKVDGISILNNYFRANTDGIDPSESKDVQISNCYIIGGDDGICFKNGAENVVISNCIIQSPSSGIKFGTSTEKVFRNVRVSDCIIYNSMVGIGMYMKDGGLIEHCSFTNITIENLQDTAQINPGIVRQQVPVYIDIDMRHENSVLGTVRHIVFDNLTIKSGNGILLQGMKEKPLENIIIRNIDFHVDSYFPFHERKKPKGFADSNFLYHSDHRLTEFIQKPNYITIANARWVNLDNIKIYQGEDIADKSEKKAIGTYNVDGLNIQHVKMWRNGSVVNKSETLQKHKK